MRSTQARHYEHHLVSSNDPRSAQASKDEGSNSQPPPTTITLGAISTIGIKDKIGNREREERSRAEMFYEVKKKRRRRRCEKEECKVVLMDEAATTTVSLPQKSQLPPRFRSGGENAEATFWNSHRSVRETNPSHAERSAEFWRGFYV